MVVLLCVILGGWLGCRVRVALSRTGAAMLAVFDGNSFVLVDPTRTTSNLFDAADYLSSTVPCIACPIRTNVLVEVKVILKWQAGYVTKVDVAKGQFVVQLLKGGEKICNIKAHSWRRVSDESSDLDKLAVPCLKRKCRDS